MKFELTLKAPDSISYCVADGVESSLPPNLEECEVEELRKERLEMAWKKLSKWIRWKEYVTIVFDTEAMTATVKNN